MFEDIEGAIVESLTVTDEKVVLVVVEPIGRKTITINKEDHKITQHDEILEPEDMFAALMTVLLGGH